MAQAQLKITLPDDKLTDIIAALRQLYNQPNATQAQLIALMENDVKTRVRNAYVAYMRQKSYDISLD
jgi:hypothetical protein